MFQRGDILLVRGVSDPQGMNAKDRPCLVVDEVEGKYLCLAITSSFSSGESNRVELPWASPFHPRTGLHKRSAAACDWFLEVDVDEVMEKLGYCPGKALLKIMQIIQDMN